MILAIDTTDRKVSACLFESGKTLAACAVDTEQTAEVLIPELKKLFDEAQRAIKDVSQIAVAVGPGSFTGIRAGIATALGLTADESDVDIVPISVLEARVAPELNDGLETIAALRARADEYFIASFSIESGQVIERIGHQAVSSEQLEELSLSRGARIVYVDSVGENPAVLVAKLSQTKRQSVERKLEPLYIKPVNAKTLKERGKA